MAVSAFAAFVAKLETLTGVFPVYTFDVPVSVDGVQIFPPYICVIDDGTVPSFEFEHTVLETTTLTVMVYAPTLAAVDSQLEIIKYNGGGVTGGLGMDFGTLPDLTTGYTNMEVVRAHENHFLAKSTGSDAQRIHGCDMGYTVSVYRT